MFFYKKSQRIYLACWGCSSDGRAVRSQRTGRGFDPPHLHQIFSSEIELGTTEYSLIINIFAERE